MRTSTKGEFDKLLQSISVLVVDGNLFMRKTARMLLTNAGVKNVHECGDGIAALEHIRMFEPDLVILEWDLPLLNGPELVRIVRSPGVFPVPDVPIMMLTAEAERRRVVAAASFGANEFLIKPVSAKTLRDRMISIFMKPRPTVQIGNYYGPTPRKLIDPINPPLVPGATEVPDAEAEYEAA
jgi:DNA-binding response OmpR family regulator